LPLINKEPHTLISLGLILEKCLALKTIHHIAYGQFSLEKINNYSFQEINSIKIFEIINFP